MGGMENPEIQSSQFDSTMEDDDFHYSIRPDYLDDEVDLIAKARRNGRKIAAYDFREEYSYGRCKDKKTCVWPSGQWLWFAESSGITWVGVHGTDSICVITKAGDLDLSRVHGMLIFQTEEKVFRKFRRNVVSEIEDIAALAEPEDPDEIPDPFRPCKPLETSLTNLLNKFDKGIEKPFGVVSVVPRTDKVAQAESYEYEEIKTTKFILEGLKTSSVHESKIDEDDDDTISMQSLKPAIRDLRTLLADPEFEETTIKFLHEEKIRHAAIKNNETVEDSSDEYDAETAVEFLKKEIMRKQDFTLERTTQIAISAFQLLLKRNFNAEEIEVCLMDPEYFVTAKEAIYKDIYVNHLERDEIEQVLADMRRGSSCGRSSSD